MQQTAKVSIIIPTLNEAENILGAIASTQSGKNIEVIVVDGGSCDDTIKIAQSLGAKVISSPPGRAMQMNAGATVASGEVLLFLHADTRLPVDFDVLICAALQQPGVVAGAFDLQIDNSAFGLRLVELGVKLRSRFFQMPYGDQGIFFNSRNLPKIGNFPALPIMEDFELIRRLNSLGRIVIINTPVVTSARRWLQKGIVKTTLLNQIIVLAYLFGVSPARIRSWYRREKFKHN
ncbi:glycosyltransferase [Nostoc piscinale CENA21]|uniref:4,4'-diaponeurosporenoate glycosyltransferase n=1 Tax=Nostoc piscinale CENA21 TaxID=224013 RepID=A0A0M4TTL4_9NOSO|nr:TIGR04283 family arsenosugar biosynthesis glycosyltransferase [Nostoc piscinale]ALF52656.1 glycosyltransferase [Nostoc piscinale CENA21]